MPQETSENFTDAQIRAATSGADEKLFLIGAAGTGKTSAALMKIANLLKSRHSAHEIMVIVPQPLLGRSYRQFEAAQSGYTGAKLNVMTYGGIARRALELFWPVVAETIGHHLVRDMPVFLNAEAAQMHLSRVIDPLIEQRQLFAEIKLPRRRIYTQIIDNLNKSALVGFPVSEIGPRLISAWSGTDQQARMYDDLQVCASAFRAYCLENGLMEYSLSLETFQRSVWPLEACRTWLMQTARHVIYDNAEEDTPAAHDLVYDLIDASESALVLFDRDAGYRRFLGADERSAYRLREACDDEIEFIARVTAGDKEVLISALGQTFGYGDENMPEDDPLREVEVQGFRYFPDMINAVCAEIVRLVETEGVPEGQIAIVTPYLSDALRFALVNRLEHRDIDVRSLRPSRPLGMEAAARCLLLLAELAHPQWEWQVTVDDLAQALSLAIGDLDPVRAYLLAATYRPANGLSEYANLSETLKRRIPQSIGERYDRLRAWIMGYREKAPVPLDYFFSQLYNDVLVQDGFRYHQALEAGNTAAALVRSARDFRRLADELNEPFDAKEYVRRVLDGVIGEQALSRPDELDFEGGVQVAPAYTFLMQNRPVTHQFWLDLGSSGWGERLHQPLGQPFVLSRNWPEGRIWTAADDALYNAEFAYRLLAGLLRRCTGRVWMTHVDYNEQGFTQQGPLMVALQRILRRRNAAEQRG